MEHFFHEPQFGEDWFTFPRFYSDLVRILPDNSHIVELGSWKGKSSAYMAVEIINSGKKIKFDCVDTWLGSPNEELHKNDPFVKENQLYNLFLDNIKPVNHIINPIRMTTLEASQLYTYNSLDVVFIDACHDYECVKQDIISWLPKIKPGHILCGHDIDWTSVKKAVTEIFGNNFMNLTDQSVWVYNKPL
jgi:predicted O-methyltransferase YrrM